MKPTSFLAALAIIIFGAVGLAFYFFQGPSSFQASYSDLYGNCTVTETVVSVGHQAATQVLPQSSSRQWAIIQNPVAATNTPTITFSGTAVSGHGYQINHASSSEFRFGMGTEIKTGNAVSVITDTGSTTVKVIQCDGRIRY